MLMAGVVLIRCGVWAMWWATVLTPMSASGACVNLNLYALQVITIGPQSARWSGLPLKLYENGFTLAHGSPREPVWEYLLSTEAAQENFVHFDTPYCLVGHSHVPLIFELVDDKAVYKEFSERANLELKDQRLIINPGGVGQPRDGDPRASYAIYDSEAQAVYHYRVEYDIPATQKKMAERGLPTPLIWRLSLGR
jgi:diadenosine tetraphosphatase ApaH/serine/threonine PP2A family protein phosphatase